MKPKLVDVPSDPEGRVACSECLANKGSQFDVEGAARRWEFERQECSDIARGDSFELRKRHGTIEYRIVGVCDGDKDGAPVRDEKIGEWQTYAWGRVLCYSCAYDFGVIRIYSPRTRQARR